MICLDSQPAVEAMILEGFCITFIITIILATAVMFIGRMLHASKYKITEANGIQESLYLELGGIKQYIQIRGKNKENPIVLFIHGGPGFPLTYLSYYFAEYLIKDFTLVCPEQRGCGRTYYKNLQKDRKLTQELLVSDIDELVDYLRKRFNQEKVMVIGQSWGTIPSSMYAKLRPEKVAAYIGIGQITDFYKGKLLAVDTAIQLAKNLGKHEDVERMMIGKMRLLKAHSVNEIDTKSLEEMIVLSLKYLKSREELSVFKQFWLGISSPFLSFWDLCWFFHASSTDTLMRLEKPLIQYMYYEFNSFHQDMIFKVPVCFISGGSDWITPCSMVEDYFQVIKAPYKEMIKIDNTGHTTFLDDPKTFSMKLRNFIRNSM